jgi:hypothetical protein
MLINSLITLRAIGIPSRGSISAIFRESDVGIHELDDTKDWLRFSTGKDSGRVKYTLHEVKIEMSEQKEPTAEAKLRTRPS